MNSNDMVNDIEKGLELIGHDKVITIFGSARMSQDDPAYNKTVELVYSISKRLNVAIMTGGGHGIMEAANKGAKLADVKSFGINISLPHEQSTNEYVTHAFTSKFLFTRKVILTKNAVGFIAVNGGYGTLDELFEILTLISVGYVKPTPVVLFGVDFWNDILEWLKTTLLEKKYIDDNDLKNIYLTDDKEEVIKILKPYISD